MSKKFSFRLEPVLKLRAYRVAEAKEKLAEILYLRIKKENEIKSKYEYLQKFELAKDGKSSIADIQTRIYHKIYVEGEIKKLTKDRSELLEIENLKRKELSEAMKNEKILAKLKERKFEAYKHELNIEEMKDLDEIAGRIARNSIINI